MDLKELKKPELLMPVSGPDTLRCAVLYGADAVYMGGEAYSLRAYADNFSGDELKDAVDYAHKNGVNIYITANIYAYDDDFPGIEEYFERLAEIGPDALLISDPGVFMIAKRVCPDIPVHISTQANNTNSGTFRFWYDQGVRRVVAARELSLERLRKIKEQIPDDMEIEAFVHGAMCISYSGRCLLSAALSERSANRGMCTHPCRWNYSLVEEKRPGQYMDVFENERGTFVMDSKDLCMIEHIPELLDCGVDSLKVEGRMKSALYTACVGRAYRKAIDDFFEDRTLYEKNINRYLNEVSACTHRPYSTGFFYGNPGRDGQIYDANAYASDYTYIGCIEEITEDGRIRFHQKNKFSVGDEIEIMLSDGRDEVHKVIGLYDEDGNRVESAPHAGQLLYLDVGKTEGVPDAVMRKKATS